MRCLNRRRALAIWESNFGEVHPQIAAGLHNLAHLLKATGRFTEAEPLMRRALAILEKSLGEDHPNVASALESLAQLLQATNRLAEAEATNCGFFLFGSHRHDLKRKTIALFDEAAVRSGDASVGGRATVQHR